jgi:nitrite reductase (NADH) small subunit/3-phenylpropionate/trans-cinnamate dioxygenase ferredoxin subunit
MALHTVCKVDQLPDGQSGVISIQGKPIAVFRTGDQYFAIDDTCPHMGASLSGGMVEEGVVTCPWHYWRFRISDGAWADNPKIKIGCYPVHIVGDLIQIEIKENY